MDAPFSIRFIQRSDAQEFAAKRTVSARSLRCRSDHLWSRCTTEGFLLKGRTIQFCQQFEVRSTLGCCGQMARRTNQLVPGKVSSIAIFSCPGENDGLKATATDPGLLVHRVD